MFAQLLKQIQPYLAKKNNKTEILPNNLTITYTYRRFLTHHIHI